MSKKGQKKEQKPESLSEMWGNIVRDLSGYENMMFDEEYHTVWIVWDQEKTI